MEVVHAPADAAALLDLALTEPEAAETRALALLTDGADAWWASVAHHALGVVRRDAGDADGALVALRQARRLADRSGDPDRVADVRATLGLTLVVGGRTRDGLAHLARAVDGVRDPALAAKVLVRRAIVLGWVLGRHTEAAADLRRALDGIRLVDEPVWEARTRNLLGLLALAVGDVRSARPEVETARALFLGAAHEAEAAMTLHNLGLVAYADGDLPTALTLYDQADAAFAAHGLDANPLAMDRCTALLAAGLAGEAVAVLEERLRASTGLPVQRAELELRAAEALLAADDPARAVDHARAALRAFRGAGREWWAAHAELVLLRSRHAAGRIDRRSVAAAERVALSLEVERSDEAVVGWLLAGHLAARTSTADACRAWERAAAYRAGRGALVQATGWLARGLEREARGDRRGVLQACRRGLDALDRHRTTLGSSELRAQVTVHGSDLAGLAMRHAVHGRPRELLWWSERWRATALTMPWARTRDDPLSAALGAPMAALRDNGRRLQEARSEGADTAQLQAERARLEDQVRRLTRHARGWTPDEGAAVVDVAALVAAVGSAALVELVQHDDELRALVVSGGRVRSWSVGSVARAAGALDFARFTLRQAARGRRATLGDAGLRLEEALLGPDVARLLGGGPVVLCPTSWLHAAPWGLLPSLAGVPHSVVPSAALWLRAAQRRTSSDRRVFVSGPGLTTGGAEIDVVAPRHPDAVVLRDGAATVDAALAALDGSGLAHVAAHGHFRSDAPLFSALDLYDGPLLVHDFERMAAPPHRVLLSACESGVMAPVGAGELLGLVAALLSVGTAGVAASVVAVNDEATADVMVDVHAALDAGADLAGALLAARLAAADDPTRAATAAAFLALGV